MPHYLQLQIPQPCTESWEAMHPTAGGRYCDSCQKKVVDFTGMSDTAIAEFFREQKGPVCGMLFEDQLQRPIRMPRRPWPWLRHVATIVLPALFLSLKSGAQIGKVKVTAAQAPRPAAGPARTLSGTVRDEQGSPVPFASVAMVGGGATSADAQGAFSIQVAAGQTIRFSSVDFEAQTIAAPREGSLDVVLRRTGKELTEVVVKALEIRRRIKGDMMGSVSYIRESAFTKKAAPEARPSLLAYPNPVLSGSTIYLKSEQLEAGAYRLQLITLGGQLVHSAPASFDAKGDAPLTMATPGVLAGTYILRAVHEPSGKALSVQVVVRY